MAYMFCTVVTSMGEVCRVDSTPGRSSWLHKMEAASGQFLILCKEGLLGGSLY
jgi:hypothetical protein